MAVLSSYEQTVGQRMVLWPPCNVNFVLRQMPTFSEHHQLTRELSHGGHNLEEVGQHGGSITSKT